MEGCEEHRYGRLGQPEVGDNEWNEIRSKEGGLAYIHPVDAPLPSNPSRDSFREAQKSLKILTKQVVNAIINAAASQPGKKLNDPAAKLAEIRANIAKTSKNSKK